MIWPFLQNPQRLFDAIVGVLAPHCYAVPGRARAVATFRLINVHMYTIVGEL